MGRIITLIYCCFFFSFGYSFEEECNECNDISKSEAFQFNSLSECYTVIEELGEGVFGKVYSVVNSKGEKFALKSYKTQNGLENTYFADPEREFQRGQFLNHPNIIKAYELFLHISPSEELTHNLILELVEGKTLHNSKNKTLGMEQMITATLELIDALRYALTLGYVHVDLHGGNLMLNRDLEIKLIDLASFFTFEELYGFFNSLPDETPSSVPSETKTTKSHALQQFVAKNPGLVAFLKAQCALKTQNGEEEGKAQIEGRQWTHNLIHAYYFNQITDIVVKILAKSNVDRQTRIDLRTRIKQLAWNYEEDIEEGQYPYLDEYVDSLVEVLQLKV